MDIHLSKDTEEGDPENEEDGVPDERKGDSACEGDNVEEGCNRGEGGDDFSEDLTIHILVVAIEMVLELKNEREEGRREETNPFPI